jgi:hypothetical protein
MELWGSLVIPKCYSWDIIKTRQASHGLTETCQKGHWKNTVPRRRERKLHTLWDRWTSANGKEWSQGTNEVLVIGLHMVGKMSMGIDLEILLKFPNVASEPRSFIIYFLLSLSLSFFLFSSYFFFFIFFHHFSLFSFFFFTPLEL